MGKKSEKDNGERETPFLYISFLLDSLWNTHILYLIEWSLFFDLNNLMRSRLQIVFYKVNKYLW
jgi:hypothetical protein